jgi:hypothetical protein
MNGIPRIIPMVDMKTKFMSGDSEIRGHSQPYRIWKNPSQDEFTTICTSAELRGLLTATDLYVWQGMTPHAEFEKETGIQGVRIVLRAGMICSNDETIALPEHFPWIFPDPIKAAEMDMDDRRAIVVTWLTTNSRLSNIYPHGFSIDGYQ